MNKNTVQYIEFPVVRDFRGNLSFIENLKHIPFEIKRAFFVYDIPHGSIRGSHAHRKLEQLIIVMSGSFDVVCDDGTSETRFVMTSPSKGLYIPKMTWCRQENFSSGCAYLVLTSDYYDENEYIRDYENFKTEL